MTLDPPVGMIMKEREVSLEVALGAQIEILRALVEVAQREQQHLIAVETDQIHVCVESPVGRARSKGDPVSMCAHEVRARLNC